MYGTRRTGVRLLLTNTTDPTRVDGYSTWYDEYGDALLRIGRLVNDFRFEKTSATGDEADPRFAAVYDMATPDPATAWPDTEASPDHPRDLFDDPRSALVSPVPRGWCALVGTQTGPGEPGRSQASILCCQTAPTTRVANTGSTACSTPARCPRPPGRRRPAALIGHHIDARACPPRNSGRPEVTMAGRSADLRPGDRQACRAHASDWAGIRAAARVRRRDRSGAREDARVQSSPRC
jgi:hypothetical protein